MSQDQKDSAVSLRQSFFEELARREVARRAREDAERAQQEADNARAMALYNLLVSKGDFLREKGLVLDHTRYAVTLDHENFRLRAYFEDDKASVTSADKRNTAHMSAAPRKQETADSVEAAVELLAQYLADESF
jgi:RNase H-fold protein (predicted Holliday junction resolvase)